MFYKFVSFDIIVYLMYLGKIVQQEEINLACQLEVRTTAGHQKMLICFLW
jgi:hypothetical protein